MYNKRYEENCFLPIIFGSVNPTISRRVCVCAVNKNISVRIYQICIFNQRCASKQECSRCSLLQLRLRSVNLRLLLALCTRTALLVGPHRFQETRGAVSYYTPGVVRCSERTPLIVRGDLRRDETGLINARMLC